MPFSIPLRCAIQLSLVAVMLMAAEPSLRASQEALPAAVSLFDTGKPLGMGLSADVLRQRSGWQLVEEDSTQQHVAGDAIVRVVTRRALPLGEGLVLDGALLLAQIVVAAGAELGAGRLDGEGLTGLIDK